MEIWSRKAMHETHMMSVRLRVKNQQRGVGLPRLSLASAFHGSFRRASFCLFGGGCDGLVGQSVSGEGFTWRKLRLNFGAINRRPKIQWECRSAPTWWTWCGNRDH